MRQLRQRVEPYHTRRAFERVRAAAYFVQGVRVLRIAGKNIQLQAQGLDMLFGLNHKDFEQVRVGRIS